MKITDIRGEQALDVLADLLEPISRLAKNPEFAKAASMKNPIETAKAMIKADRKLVLEILAICKQESVEEYNPNVFELGTDLVELLSDPNIQTLFFS